MFLLQLRRSVQVMLMCGSLLDLIAVVFLTAISAIKQKSSFLHLTEYD